MKLKPDFYLRDVLEVAPELLGKLIVVNRNNTLQRYCISELEAYRGVEDLACHASKGRTNRTQVMFKKGGLIYVYLIYGVHWMLNVVTGPTDNPQAILIRSVKECKGPGRLGKELGIDKSFYGEDLNTSSRIWIEEGIENVKYKCTPRINVDFAGETWKNKPWRFILDS